jgi:hypothetical protein
MGDRKARHHIDPCKGTSEPTPIKLRGEHLLEPAAGEGRIAVWGGERLPQRHLHRRCELAATDEHDPTRDRQPITYDAILLAADHRFRRAASAIWGSGMSVVSSMRFAQVGVIAHLVTRLVPWVGAIHAAPAVSVAPAAAVIRRVLLGMLLGDADRRMIAAANLAMQACDVTSLAVGSTAIILTSGCILFGLGIGSLLSLPPLIRRGNSLSPMCSAWWRWSRQSIRPCLPLPR